MSSVETLLQFLYDGNYLGFLQAIFVTGFLNVDLFYGLLSMFFFVPVYIRTHSLLFVSILWILLGGIFIVAMPLISGLAIFLMIMGFAGVLFKLFSKLR